MVALKVDALELHDGHRPEFGAHRKSRIIGQRGRKIGCRRQNLVQFSHFDPQQVIDLRDLARRHGVMLQKGVDIEPIAHLARDASRRGMGLLEVSHLLQLRHFVSDSCGGAPELSRLEDRFGPDRFSAFDMCIDHRFEYLLFPLAQFLRFQHRPLLPSLFRHFSTLNIRVLIYGINLPLFQRFVKGFCKFSYELFVNISSEC